jgi:quinol-cytochrome oxidoreductase complex cytochrome b subunit
MVDVKKLYEKFDEAVEEGVDFVNKRLARTTLMAIKFMLPSRISNPFEWSGVLTFVSFFVLAFTGGLLALYYDPTFASSTTAPGGYFTGWDTVFRITWQIPFGYAVRSIHYWASNIMIVAAFVHLSYYYIRGRYKNPNEIIWVTGILLGLLAILEAYTGYDLVLNERAVQAINIGRKLLASLQDYSPLLPSFGWLIEGEGIFDIVTRFYGFHLILIPFIMLVGFLVHFPKNLKLDIPSIAFTLGMITILAGLVPVELGPKYLPTGAIPATVPEWYLTGLYALLRTGGYAPQVFTGFLTGVAVPGLVAFIFVLVPFMDRKLKRNWFDRAFFPNLLLGTMANFLYITILGYIEPSIPIRPDLFYGSIFLIGFACFTGTYGLKDYYLRKAGLQRGPDEKPSIPDKLLRLLRIDSYEVLFPLTITFLFVAGGMTWVAYTVMLGYGTTVGVVSPDAYVQGMREAILYGIPVATLLPTGIAAVGIWLGTKLNPRPKAERREYVLNESIAGQIMVFMFAVGLTLTGLTLYSIAVANQFSMLVYVGALMVVFGGAYHLFRLTKPVPHIE